jgi:DNA-binding transcriptional LysR family regulator
LRIPGALRYYASPSYLKARGTPRHPRELERHDCLLMSARSQPALWKFSVAGKPVSVTVRPRASANSFVVVGEFAKAGLGIARMPDYIGTPWVEEGSLRPVLDGFVPAASGPLHAIYPSARHLSSKVRALLDLLDERAEDLHP